MNKVHLVFRCGAGTQAGARPGAPAGPLSGSPGPPSGAGRKALDRAKDTAQSGRMTEATPGTPDIKPAQLEEKSTAVVREIVPMNALRDFFGRAFSAVMTTVQEQHVQLAGPPFALYRGMPTDVVDVEAGFPLAAPFKSAGGEDATVVAGSLPAGRAYEAPMNRCSTPMARSWRGCRRMARARGRQCGSTTSLIRASNPTRQNGKPSWSGRSREKREKYDLIAAKCRFQAPERRIVSLWPHYSSTPRIMS